MQEFFFHELENKDFAVVQSDKTVFPTKASLTIFLYCWEILGCQAFICMVGAIVCMILKKRNKKAQKQLSLTVEFLLILNWREFSLDIRYSNYEMPPQCTEHIRTLLNHITFTGNVEADFILLMLLVNMRLPLSEVNRMNGTGQVL